MRGTIVAGSIGLAMLLALPAFGRGAQAPEPSYRLMLEGDVAGMGRALQLSTEHRQQMDLLHLRDMAKLRESKRELEAQTRVLFDLYADPRADAARLRAQFDLVQGLMRRTMATHFDHMLEMRAMLSPAQRRQFLMQGARLLGEHDERRMHGGDRSPRHAPRGR